MQNGEALNGIDIGHAKEYLSKHGIHILFEQLARELIQTTPDKPLPYLLDRLEQIHNDGGIAPEEKEDLAEVHVLLSPPGSGTSSFCDELAKKEGVSILNLSKSKDSDEDKIERILDSRVGCRILYVDGFPRTMKAAIKLNKQVKPTRCIQITCPPRVCETRLLRQAQFKSGPPVNSDTIGKRLKEFNTSMLPVISLYDALEIVQHIDNSGSLEDLVAKAADI
eukprot:TRINITY_DN21854_c0_g1_i1.p1 TRINITY_DN21854_c0_g1~~TRINITY_DN21854_c0_g1_i1.p1  ORF type:complete len:223 (+),score=50.33 TRINITY_DN21854_c0_g1_i1:50-718(+)